MRFPQVITHDLNGRQVVVPDELPDGPRVVMVAFRRDQVPHLATWELRLRRMHDRCPRLSVWELPALSRIFLPGRAYIDGGMRAGIVEEDAREHTLTAYTDLRALGAALEISDRDDIHVFLLDDEGCVLWRAEGAATDEEAASLEAALVSCAERIG